MLVRYGILGLLIATSAFALDIHPDYRYGFGTCPTWGTGRFSEVQAFIRVKEVWNPMVSNYPVGWAASTGKSDCRYKGDPMPVAKPGDYVVPGNLCKPKLVIPNICEGTMTKCQVNTDCVNSNCVPGSQPATSWPLSWVSISADYNGGGTGFPSGCIWDKWAYGAPSVTTNPMP